MKAVESSATNIVRGSARRTFLALSAVCAVVDVVGPLAIWLSAKDSALTRVAAMFALVVMSSVILLCACVASSFTYAEVRDRELLFYFCGIRTRSFLLDGSIMFEDRTFGRCSCVVIRSNGSSYVPNGCLDRHEVINMLRRNGVLEQKAAE